MPTAPSDLRASLEKHNQTFETLLSLIPAKFYLARDDNNDQVGSIVSLSGQIITAATGYI
jgi:60S ribosome biogenesis protein Rrp14